MTLPYLDFTLRLRPDGRGGASAIVVHSAAGGGGTSSLRLPLEPEQLHLILRVLGQGTRDPAGAGAGAGPLVLDDPARPPTAAGLGRLLSEQLFQGRVRDVFLKSRTLAAAGGHPGLRLRLLFDLEDAEGEGEEARLFRQRSLALASLPWELIHDPESNRPLARGRDTPVVRVLAVRAEAPRPPLEPPLRVLLVTAEPEGLPAVDPRSEVRGTRAALEAAGIGVDLLEHARLETLRAQLTGRDYHAVQFIGHGDLRLGEGVLAFETPDGRLDPVPGKLLADTLRGLPSLRLVTVGACDSAAFRRREGFDPFTGVATALVEAGIPAVVGMQLAITGGAAKAFAVAFYGALAAGVSIERATSEGRLAISAADSKSREWALPVLFLPLAGEPVLGGLAAALRVPAELRIEIRIETLYIEEKSAGFVGRGPLRDRFEEFVQSEGRGYFFLLGDPGIGKTAFVAELVRGRRCLHHFNQRATFVIQPETFLRNLCAQLIVERRLGYDSLPPRAGRDGGFLEELLHRAAAGLAPGEKLLIAVDALDESDTESLPRGVNPLFLPVHLPPGVVFLVSSRPPDHRPLPRVDGPQQQYQLDPGSKENLDDVRELVGNHLGLRGIRDYLRDRGLSEAGFVEEMAERSEGNFMYLHHVLPAIARGAYRGDGPAEIPTGLRGYYEQQWERMRIEDERTWFDLALPVLHLITVAEMPLSAELIDLCLGRPGLARVRSVLQRWRPFLHDADAIAEDGRTVRQYSLYHTSFFKFVESREAVRDQEGSLQEARERLFLHHFGPLDPEDAE